MSDSVQGTPSTIESAISAAITPRKPLDSEIDVYGLTHVGNLRQTNQDHFIISSLRRDVVVHQTSLPASESQSTTERLALLAVVADGVGSSLMGGEASRQAVEGILNYVAACAKCFYRLEEGDDRELHDALSDAAMRVHADIAKERADGPPEARGMATTLTVWLGVWPYAYLLQVGDSRCYVLRAGVLTQISRDQTIVQDLVDAGVLTRTQAMRSPLSNVLSSAIGGEEAMPVVTRMESAWDTVGLLCSDGLTKHVSDEQIAERLRTMTSAKQVCEALLQDALDAGGSDNITIVVGRPSPKKIEHPLLHATVR
jgi:serine/threonine protein phosphatase PrpC